VSGERDRAMSALSQQQTFRDVSATSGFAPISGHLPARVTRRLWGQEQTIGATRGAHSGAAISQGFMPECLAQAYAAERQCGKLRSVRRSQNSRRFAEQPPGKTLRQRAGAIGTLLIRGEFECPKPMDCGNRPRAN
jgi:hypothetical protein